MRLLLSRGLAIALLISVALGGLLHSNTGKDAQADRIAGLVKRLGSDAYVERDEAGRQLRALGEKALPALRQAAQTGKDVETRRRAQQIVRMLTPAKSKSTSIGLEMVLIEAGEFHMGSPIRERNRRADEQMHRVRITRAFYLGVFEVTQEEYTRVIKTNPSWFANKGAGQNRVMGQDTNRFPVEQVTWYDAIEFCNRLSKMDGLPPYYNIADAEREANSITSATVTVAGGDGYRLPTEAEWEYACREWSNTPFHYGTNNTGREANVKPGLAGGYAAGPAWKAVDRTTTVGSYMPNSWGLFDMHGNAAEWCWDWYDANYQAESADDPQGPKEGIHRVLRGGSWLVTDGSCRSASRFWHRPQERHYYAGFRICKNP